MKERVMKTISKCIKSSGNPKTPHRPAGRPIMEQLEERRLLSGGYLDTTFAANGLATTNFSGGFDTVNRVAIQADGKIVAAGTASDDARSGGKDFLVARYNVDGTLDTTFGAGGRTYIDFSSRSDEANGLAIQSDGKIVVGGSSTSTSNSDEKDFALARLKTDGTLDTTFGTGGRQTTDFTNGRDDIAAIRMDGNDIVAIGSTAPAGSPLHSDFALARYLSTGALDGSFGVAGRQTTDIGSDTADSAFDGLVQSDGKIVAAGGTLVSGHPGDFALVRYNTNGSLDSSFGTGGKVLTDFGGGEEARALALDGAKIVAVGRSNTNGSDDVALARYNANGSLDSTFGAGGKTVSDLFSGSTDYALSAVVDASGRLIVGGSTAAAGDVNHSLFMLAGYNDSGALDSTFGVGGLSTTDAGAGNNAINDLAIDEDGRLIAGGVVPGTFSTSGGTIVPATSDFAVARYSGTNTGPIFATSPAPGSDPTIRVFDAATHEQLLSFDAFDGFQNGVTVATGDVNGDGYPDIIAAAGSGGASNIRVFDGKTGTPLAGPLGSFLAFPGGNGNADDPQFFTGAFQGPVNVAAGDINNDGHDDIIVSVAADGPPHLKVFSGADGSELLSLLVYPGSDNITDPAYFTNAFQGGVRVASGDVNNDGFDDIITGAGPGAGPHVKVYDGKTQSVVNSYFAYDASYAGGVRVAAGDYDGNGTADILTAPGVGAPPNVKVIDAASGNALASFFAYDPGFVGGLQLASTDINGDGKAEIFTIPGSGAGPNVKIFQGGGGSSPSAIASFFAYDANQTNGSYIAAAS
jgi:uncharacterized delta-60 repeat protein